MHSLMTFDDWKASESITKLCCFFLSSCCRQVIHHFEVHRAQQIKAQFNQLDEDGSGPA
jgi:hypothetical protein